MGFLHPQGGAAALRYPTLLLLLWSPCTLLAQETTNTFQTITATSSSPSATSDGSPSPTTVSPSATPTNSDYRAAPAEGFNYYFIIIAGTACLFVLFFVLMARRRRNRALMRQHRTQRVLSEDTAGYRSPRYGRGWGPSDGGGSGGHTITSRVRMMGRRREEVPEGLNERGEAPPPYMPGSKPPSLHSDDEGDLEMGDMRRPAPKPKEGEQPPGYGHEHTSSSSSLGHVVTRQETAVTRPEAAVTRS